MSTATANAPVMTAAGGQVYHPRPARNMLIILAGMALMVTYVETMVLPSFENFVTFFNYPPTSTVVWILSAYLLVGVIATPVFGKLGDIYGKKKMLMVAMSIYAVAVSIAGFTPNIGAAFGVSTSNQIYLLIAARGFQGIGMGMFPLAFAMIPEFFPANRVGQAQGVVSAMFAGGACIGLVLGGLITTTYGWQFTYHTVIPVAIGLVILAFYILRESPTRTGESVDVAGISALGIGLAMLMLGLTESTYWGWTNFSATMVGPLPWGVPEFIIVAAILFLFFGFWEGRVKFPVLRLRALKERNILVSNINGVLSGLTMFVMFTTLTIVAELPAPPGFNQNPFYMGLLSLPAAASMLALGMPLGRMTARYGPKPVMVLGFALSTFGALLLTQYANPAFQLGTFHSGSPNGFAVPVLLLIAPAFVLVGTVAVLISMSNVIVLSVGPRELGVQTGMNQTFRNLGSAIGPVLVSAIISLFIIGYIPLPPPIGNEPIYSVAAFQYCFVALAVFGLIGVGLSAFLKNYRFQSDGTRHEVSLVGKHTSTVFVPGAADPPMKTPSEATPARPPVG